MIFFLSVHFCKGGGASKEEKSGTSKFVHLCFLITRVKVHLKLYFPTSERLHNFFRIGIYDSKCNNYLPVLFVVTFRGMVPAGVSVLATVTQSKSGQKINKK